MVNKKILLFIAGMFFVLVFSGEISGDATGFSHSHDVRIDWNGGKFEWIAPGTDSHNVEGYGYSDDHTRYSCDEDGDCPKTSGTRWCNCAGGVNCLQASGSGSFNVVYGNTWYKAYCLGPSHDKGRHFANPYPSGNTQDTGNYFTPSNAYATCYDYDGDNKYSSISPPGLSISNVCGNSESAYCDAGHTEICGNGIDEDCSGGDLACVPTCTDNDNDGYGNPASNTCSYPQLDCDDSLTTGPNINPGATEIAGNNIDENCDGIILNYCTDTDGDKYATQNSGQCDSSSISGFKGYADCNDADNKKYPYAPELCDSKDNQCTGNVGFGETDENPNTICPLTGNLKIDICISGTCKTPIAYWTSDSQGQNKITSQVTAQSGNKFYLVLENYPRGISKWEFEIFEDDIGRRGRMDDDEIRTRGGKLSGTLSGGNKLIAEWEVTQADINKAQDKDNDGIYEFYFVAKGFKKLGGTWEYDGGASGGTWERKEYGVSGNGTWKSDDGVTAGTWETREIGLLGVKGTFQGAASGMWESTWASGGANFGTWRVYGFPRFGTWNKITEEDESVYEYQSLILGAEELQGPITSCSDGIKNQGETGIDCGGSCPTCIGQPPTNITNVTINCSQYTTCSSATTQAKCIEADSCQISSLDECSWNTLASPPSCNSYELQGEDNIPCYYKEEITQTCDKDDFLTYELTPLTQGCEEKEPVSIICSSKTKLPLENKFGIVLTIIAITGIYFFFFRKKKE